MAKLGKISAIVVIATVVSGLVIDSGDTARAGLMAGFSAQSQTLGVQKTGTASRLGVAESERFYRENAQWQRHRQNSSIARG